MKRYVFFLLISVFSLQGCFSQDDITTVYKAGEDGYASYRIPALITLPDGDLLAFTEGRKEGSADFGDIEIIFKRSTDNGKTWSDSHVVAENGNLQAGNAAPVVDMTDPDYPDGRIFLFYNTGDKDEQHIRKGNGTRRVFYKTSEDKGETWSDPTEITDQAKKEDWRSYANTPGHAAQFQHGKYEGRIYVAANHSAGDPQQDFSDYNAHGYYTDDHGETFHLSENIFFPSSNESTAAPLTDGQLMMNSRNQDGAPKARIVSISKDGGETWDKMYYDHELPDPVNQGSILKVGENNGKAILAFTNDADTTKRQNLTLRISKDGGKSWNQGKLVDKEGESTAYSDISKIDDHKIGVLYERKGYKEIAFRVMEWD